MWAKPWNMKEGFLIGGGLLFTGLLLQVAMGPFRWELFAWPVNLMVLILLLAAVGIMYALRKEFYAFEWMMHTGAAVPCLTYAVALTILMGLLPQVRMGGMPWLSQGTLSPLTCGSSPIRMVRVAAKMRQGTAAPVCIIHSKA